MTKIETRVAADASGLRPSPQALQSLGYNRAAYRVVRWERYTHEGSVLFNVELEPRADTCRDLCDRLVGDWHSLTDADKESLATQIKSLVGEP